MFFGKKKQKADKNDLLTDEEKKRPSEKDDREQPDYGKQPPKGITRFWKMKYWQKFFNVTTKEIMKRLILAMTPFNSTPIFPTGKPDLYGPLWVYICLMVTVIIWGHFSSWLDFEHLENNPDHLSHQADLKKVGRIASLMSFYVFVVPLAIHVIFSFCGAGTPGYQRTFAIYAYSYTIFIPGSVLLIPPFEYLRYATLGVWAFISLYFISKELMDAGKKYLDDKYITIIALMWACLHLLFWFLLKVYYFD
jgi:protein YIPF1/2